uniref:Uncharacterized protein n=1 Tax=Tanacetum cinerariifolium TaxID=118510 RepID=A0A6L2N8S1_TANCI|nr:hypothetical protein [Tanacetum cinerariifolium]
MIELIVSAKPITKTHEAVSEHTALETYGNITLEKRAYIDAEAEAIHMILSGESLNKQDIKTNLFWEFGKFTSRYEESIESYYSRFCKMMKEMIKNKLEVATMQVNVQCLQHFSQNGQDL